MRFDGSVVLVTGASRGLGAAIARAFGAAGASVVVNYFQSKEKAEGVAAEVRRSGGRAMAVKADVRDEAAVGAMVAQAEAEFGPVDVLVHNALHDYRFDPNTRRASWEIAWADFQSQLDGTLKGAHHAVQAVLPGMRRRRGGRIVFIGTNLVFHPVVAYHDYTAAKGALLAYARSLASELGPEGIAVNTVAGGLLDRTDASAATTEDVKQIVRSVTPLRRITTPAELADVCLFFASPWARAVTGQCLVVDGGLVMR